MAISLHAPVEPPSSLCAGQTSDRSTAWPHECAAMTLIGASWRPAGSWILLVCNGSIRLADAIPLTEYGGGSAPVYHFICDEAEISLKDMG